MIAPARTVELRWFVGGAVPPTALGWFAALGPRVAAEVRTDRYLPPSSPDDPGVKVREGRLEVKRRAHRLGVERPVPSVEGAAEAWVKWSLDLRGDEEPDAWTAVEKTRWRRAFALRGGDLASMSPGDVPPAGATAGASVELSTLRVGDAVWWSVCVEAVGRDEAARLDACRRAAAHVFARAAPPGLTAAASMGYPAWLWSVGRGS